ncbi:MAG: DNA polymerase I [Candidatus Uhrbacteria bacterium]|nr:DNA polymerase I [Candidatus Uhrbacteria bacterium]
MSSQRPKLLLLDANALLHRAWHAIPPLTAPNGMVVNAVYGMANVSLKLFKEESPDLFVACWDTAAPTFRHEAFVDYKAQREEKEQELYDQIPVAKEVLESIGIPSFSKDGYEADDLIGTLAMIGVREGYDVRIVTGDRDALQLVSPHVDVLAFKKGVSETKTYDADAVVEEYGITPEQIIEWKAIRGDTSDNIPGIKGIGEKGATELIQKFKTLEGAIAAASDPSSDIKPGMRAKLLEGAKIGREALKLVTIMRDVPLKIEIEDFHGKPDHDAFVRLAGTYGFRSLIGRFPGVAQESDSSKEKKTRSKKALSDDDGFVSCKDENDTIKVLKDFASAKDLVIAIPPTTQTSLFESSTDGVVMGTSSRSASIPFSLLRLKEVRPLAEKIFTSDDIGKICHDAKMCMRVFSEHDFELRGVVHDTLLAAYLLSEGERQADLRMISLHELGEDLPEGDALVHGLATIIRSIADHQRASLVNEHLDEVMRRFELPLLPVLRTMERNGILLDLSYLKKLSKEITAEKKSLELKMEEIVGHAFNPGSPIQLSQILFDELGLSTKGIKRSTRGYSTAASELEKLEGTHPIIEFVSQYREVSKMLSTYIDALPLLVDKDGRVHTTFNQAVAATGRLSSSDPNLQNIPIRTELGRRMRRAFIASPGMRLVSCDYSQIELRVIAALSKDKKMLEAFASGADIHTATASAIWGVAMDEVTKEQRRAAKAINFGIIYGQGPNGLSRTAGISFAEAKEFIEKYFQTFVGVKTYLEETKVMARSRGYVETLFGRRRNIPDIVSGIPALRAAAERMAINMPAQGTAADLMKLAMIRVAERLASVSRNTRLLLQVHDELVLEVPEGEVDVVATFVKATMESAAEIGCPILVEAKVGENWDEMNKVR